MRPMILLAVFALLTVPLAAAQTGPAPGYDDPLLYASDYAAEEADNASADPADYATDHASLEAAVDEAEHAAYVACWTLDEYAGAQVPGCEAYYVPPGEAGPIQGHEEHDANVTEAADEVVNATETLADEALNATQAVVDDPANATDHVQEIVDALLRFVERVVAAVLAPPLALADVTAQGVLALVDGLTSTGHAMGTATVTLSAASLDAVHDASEAAGSAGATLHGAAQDGLAEAVQLTASAGSAVADGASSAVDAVQHLAEDVQKAVRSWFAPSPRSGDTPDLSAPSDVEDDVDSLLDRALSLLD